MKLSLPCVFSLVVCATISFSCMAQDGSPVKAPFIDDPLIYKKARDINVERAFKEYPQYLAVLAADEKKVIGQWYDYDTIGTKASGADYKGEQFDFILFPNHIIKMASSHFAGDVSIAYQPVQLIGSWRLEDSKVVYTITTVIVIKDHGTMARLLVLEHPITGKLFDINMIVDGYYVKERVGPFPISEEVSNFCGILPQTYRWVMYRVLEGWGDEPGDASLNMREELDQMTKSGKTSEDILKSTDLLRLIFTGL